MKKILALLLVLATALSLTTCGGKDNPGASGRADAPATSVGGAPEATRPTVDDTSAPDVGQTEENDTSGDDSIPELAAGDWPDNVFTGLIPKPSAGTAAVSDTGDSYCVIEMDWSIEEAMAYAKQLQNAGFSVNVAAQDMSQAGMYTFVADNADGVRAKILYLGPEIGNRVIRIEK